jgi:predicted phage baseplate assembly protein
MASRAGERLIDYAPALEDRRQGLGVFSDRPREHDALCLGFSNNLGGHSLAISLACRIEGIGVDPTDPPLAWEAWSGLEHRWVAATLESDGTGGLNRDGLIVLSLPYDAAPTQLDTITAFWVRARVLAPRPGQPGYTDTPRITGIAVESLGAIVPASHSNSAVGEAIGSSNGSPGQTFTLQNVPVQPRRAHETLEVERDDGTFDEWIEVPDFAASQSDQPHFVLDDATGTIELGPCIRSPDGEERQYGRVPPAGRKLRFSAYRSGGGVIGNVGARTINVLQSSIPYIASVLNHAPAVGGTDAEDIEHAKWRAPQILKARERAVTPEDFEVLAREATPGIARARCLAARDAPVAGPATAAPGSVRLELVPALSQANGPLLPDQLQVPPRIRQEVQAYLDERRLLTSELLLEVPTYTWVSVLARVRPKPRASKARVAQRATEAMYRFIHPTVGGPDFLGWPFGRELFAGEIYSLIQSIDGVDLVEEVTLHRVDPATREFGPPLPRVAPAANGLFCSHEHRVRVD